MRLRLSNGGFFWLISCVLFTISAANPVNDNHIEDKFETLSDFPELLQPIQNEVQELKRMIANLTQSLRKSPCDSNPCLFGGKCIETSNGQDYECTDCPSPTPNKNCEGVSHNLTNFWLNNTMYTMFRDRSLSWFEAKAKCEIEGMEMAMPKDRLTHQFLRQILSSYETPKSDVFWIGLRKPALSYKWQWVDGSELTGYKGWAFTPLHTEQCVDICADEGFDFNWDADPCFGVEGWDYYALCQQHLSLSSL